MPRVGRTRSVVYRRNIVWSWCSGDGPWRPLWSYAAGDTTAKTTVRRSSTKTVARRHVTRGRYCRGNRRRWTTSNGRERIGARTTTAGTRWTATIRTVGGDRDLDVRPPPTRGLSIVVRVIVLLFLRSVWADNAVARAPVGRVATATVRSFDKTAAVFRTRDVVSLLRV